jgi:hypothetical protein
MIGRRFQMIALVAMLPLALPALAQEPRWFKGQTHAHTVNSDGDELPRAVARWYQDHEYNFLVITDHGYITDVTRLDTDGNRDDFILIPGEEITDKKYLHVNGLNMKRQVAAQKLDDVVANLQANIDSIRGAAGTPQVNHPNWHRAITCEQLAALKDVRLVELYNMDKTSNNFAAGGYPGMEEIWDCVLSKGMVIYGLATDDTHDYEGEYRPERAYPGKGWVMVRATELTPEAIMTALEKGDFYSTFGLGVTLEEVTVTDQEYRLKIKASGDLSYTTQFIGQDGVVLKEEHGLTPSYAFTGQELYVRAKVICSSGDLAIAQPVFPGAAKP